LKSLLRHIKHTTVTDFVILLFGLIQTENLAYLDELLLRNVLHIIWTSDFTTDSSITQKSM